MNLNFIAMPMGQLLNWIVNVVGDYGYAIIAFTIITKLLLLPINIKQTHSTKRMNEIQPKMKALQEKYKNDKEKLNEKLMELYKEEKYNPASGCLPALIQLPIVIALFNVLREPVKYVFGSQQAYDAIHKGFWWMTNIGLAETKATVLMIGGFGLPLLALISGVTTYIQMKMVSPNTKDPTQSSMTKMMPIMFAYITYTVPAGLAIYWIVGNLFTIVQQYIMLKNKPVQKEA
ncbi:MAG TPA: YidC/Oxa1 family membrane protein insertase [Patescibacteria group bacterium]|nr:YidC/Oxa1 family membrane protein insertase [Patescibacteria group bacterium]